MAVVVPVKPGQEETVKIVGVGQKGDGIAKIEGFTIIVPGAKLGDNCAVKITRVHDTYAFAEKQAGG